MMETTGACAGIENYSRFLTGRAPGDPPPTLFEYVPDHALIFVDGFPCERSAARRDVQGLFPPQIDSGGIWLPPAELHG